MAVVPGEVWLGWGGWVGQGPLQESIGHHTGEVSGWVDTGVVGGWMPL